MSPSLEGSIKMFGKKEIPWFLLFFFVACYAQFVNRSFMFDPYYSLYGDASNIYFFHNLHDPTLLTKDPLTHQFLAKFGILNSGMGFFYVYKLLLNIFSLSIAIKFVSILLCLASTLVVYRWVLTTCSASYAIFLSGIFLIYFLSMDSFFSGIGRGFGAFLYVFFLFFISKEKFLLSFVCLLCCTLFYPAILPGVFITYLLAIFFVKHPNSRLDWYWCHLAVLLAVIVIGSILLIHSDSWCNILMNLKDLQTYKLYQGRSSPVQMSDPVGVILYFIFNLYEHSALYRYLTIFFSLVAISLVLVVKGWWRLPRIVWLMFAGACISFFLILPFHPTTASRQFVFTMPLFLLFLIGHNLYKLLQYKQSRPEMCLLLIMPLFLAAHVILNDINSFRLYQPVYDYFEKLPKDVLVAGPTKSKLIRTLPFFTKRPVYFSEKMRDSWRIFFSLEFVRERRKSVIDAMYADSLDVVRNFIKRSHVNYFIVESQYYDYDRAVKNDLFVTGNSDEASVYGYLERRLHEKNFALFKFAQEHFDFKYEVPGNTIYVVSASSISKGT